MDHAYVRLTLAIALAAVFGIGCMPSKNNSQRHRSDDEDEAVDAGEADAADGRSRDAARNTGTERSRSTASSGTSTSTTSSASSGSSTGSNPGTSGMGDGSLDCPDEAPADARVPAEDSGPVIWSGVVRITGTFTLSGTGARLTIIPGTKIFVDPGGAIEIGWNSQQVAVDALGTESSPIQFCRTKKSGGNWKGIRIDSGVLTSSAFKYTVIEGAGQGAAALAINAGILVDHVWVRDSASNGVSASNFRDDSKNLSVANSAAAPLVLAHALAVDHLPLGGTFTGNTEDIAHLTFEDVTAETRFHDIGIPYQLDRGMSLNADSKLTVDPGVEWRVGVDQRVELGWNSAKLEIHLDGTQEKPILIRGADARPGSWKGLTVRSAVYATSTLKFVEIQHAGGFSASALAIQAPITASDITLRDNAHEAFFIDAQGLTPESARFTVTNTKGTAGRVAANALTSVPAGGSYVGNQLDYIEVEGGDIVGSGTVPEVDVSFHVLDRIDISQNASLTIAAGAKLEMQNGVVLNFGWNSGKATLIAVGTAAKPIQFRGILDQPGYWDGILIGPNVTTDSKLDFVQIAHGGGGTVAAANLNLRAPITVTNSKFYGSSTFGLIAPASFTPDYESLNTFEANSMGSVRRE